MATSDRDETIAVRISRILADRIISGAVEPGAVTFPLCRQVIDEYITVTESEIAAAMRTVATTDHWIIEGAAGVAVAGLLKAASGAYRGRQLAAVLCGRNIGLDKFLHAIGG